MLNSPELQGAFRPQVPYNRHFAGLSDEPGIKTNPAKEIETIYNANDVAATIARSAQSIADVLIGLWN